MNIAYPAQAMADAEHMVDIDPSKKDARYV